MKDNYRHKGLRKQLVEGIRAKGIKDERVLDAINKVPRHYFLDAAFMESAYVDQAFPIGEGQTISQPFTVAYQSTLLAIEPGSKVLEIGTGSGYQAAVLAEMGARVYTIERQKKLYSKTKAFLEKIGYTKIKTFFGDGYEGLPSYAPFDRIIITAGGGAVPEALKGQLKVGGIMVMPLGEGDVQKMIRIAKMGQNDYEIKEWDSFKFVPLLKGKSW